MKLSTAAMLAALAISACLSLASCKEKETKPGEKSPAGQSRPSGSGDIKRDPLQEASSEKPSDSHPVLAPANIGEVLSSLPCKLENSYGAYAIFPTNPAAGQNCFALAPDTGKEIPPFDIKADEIAFIIHQNTSIDPGGVKLVKWSAKNGKPCLQPDCATEVPSSRKSFPDPNHSGSAFLIINPQKPVPLSPPSPDFYGLTIRDGESFKPQLPVFN